MINKVSRSAFPAMALCVALGCSSPSAPSPPAPPSQPVDRQCAPEPALTASLAHAAKLAPEAPPFLAGTQSGPRIAVGAIDAAPTATFRIASITKTFTAAATLRLVETGRLSLGASVRQTCSPGTVTALVEGGYDVDAITVQQLLLHDSGLYDYASDERYAAGVGADPSHRWSRAEQIAFAMRHGRPVGAPGVRYAYSDTGYIVLGEILERATGVGLAEAYRTLLRFDRLHLSATWLETLEPVPTTAGARLDQRYGGLPIILLDPSEDLYGGGGLVSSTTDLLLFYRGLFGGMVFDRPDTLVQMTTIPRPNEATGAAMGLFRVDEDGVTCWFHHGFWEARVEYCPATDVGSVVVAGDATKARGTLPAVNALAIRELVACR